MVKKFSTLALAALIALPAVASAAASPAELEAQIESLTKQLSALQADMAALKEDTQSTVESISEKSEKWDDAARIQLSGDFRTRLDYVSADSVDHYTALNIGRGVEWFTNPDAISRATWGDAVHGANSMGTTAELLMGFGLTPGQAAGQLGSMLYGDPAAISSFGFGAGGTVDSVNYNGTPTLLDPSTRTQNLVAFMKTFTPAQRAQLFGAMGYTPTPAADYTNDTMWTNRLRVNLRAKATEDVEFKARLAMYKSWGMSNNPVDYQYNAGNGGGPFMLNSLSFDGNSTRQPEDNALRVDRAFMNWNSIGGAPVWFSIGRRPTTDGPPSQLRMGADDRLATPVAFMDYPFDGASLGYAYKSLFGVEDFPGRVRFCYGRGFESGPQDGNVNEVNDVDFAGLSWDVYDKGNRFFSIQSFAAMNMFNVPDGVNFVNPMEFAAWENNHAAVNPLDPSQNMMLDRANLGNIYHTDAVYTSKVQDFNYFLAAGWSRTKANGMDEMGTSLLGSWWAQPEDKDGYSVYLGGRYDIPASPFKVGLEYNYGTKNWISFTPGNDDLYASKLATRGHVIEAYGLWDIPAGEAISKYGKAFMRLGYQHYMYNYTGSGFWLGEPLDIDELKNDPLNAQFYTPVDTMDQVYVSIEAWF
ncbi:MAG: DUF3373 family protein [Desulfobulbaceae bacterium]|nr:DUF3373 family protein [Desulfobulbaceae bacterium]